MPDPMHFDAHADIYDRARPPYPAALWARLNEKRLVRPGTRVVEIGAGSGQATGPMLDAGALVTAVEPGRTLAASLSRRCPRATVIVTTAEAVTLPPAAFDLAVIATAVHWLDLGVVLPKLHRALRPAGHLVVWRTIFGDPSADVTAFRECIAAIAAARREPPRPGPSELDTDAWVDQLTSSGHFVRSHVEHFHWSVELRTPQIHDLFTTFSDWTAAEVDQAARAADDLGGLVVEHYVSPLIVLDRAEPA